MSTDFYGLDDLAQLLGRDRRDVEKMVSRGRIPGRKVGGEWRFNAVEIRHWLEGALREYSDDELAGVEHRHASDEVDELVPVTSLLKLETVEVPLAARTKRSVLEGLIEAAGRTWHVWEPSVVLEAVLEREGVLSTGFENGVAIPHPRNQLPDVLGESIIAYGRTLSGIPFGAPRGSLTDIFFLVLCRDSRTHLKVLARLGRMIQLPDFVDQLRSTDDPRQSFDLICAADDQLSR